MTRDKDGQALAEAAMEWVATLDDQPDDPVIRRRFLAWLGADPAHGPAFRAAEQAWAAALENQEVALPFRRRKQRRNSIWVTVLIVLVLMALYRWLT